MEKRQTSLCAAPCRDAGKRLACPGARVRGMLTRRPEAVCVSVCVGGVGGVGALAKTEQFFFFFVIFKTTLSDFGLEEFDLV